MSFKMSKGCNVLFFACFMSLAVSVHSQDTEKAPPATKPIANRMTAILTSQETHFFAQEPVIVDLHVVNNLGKFVFLNDFGSPLTDKVFTVTDHNGVPVPLTAYGRQFYAKAASPKVPSIVSPPDSGANLDPGTEVVYHVWLNRVFDMSADGEYIITATKLLPSISGKDQPSVSNRLIIHIETPQVPPYSNRIGADEVPPTHPADRPPSLQF